MTITSGTLTGSAGVTAGALITGVSLDHHSCTSLRLTEPSGASAAP
jgi:hypothetical protein